MDNCKFLVPDDFTPSSIETAFNYARKILEQTPEIEEVILVIPTKKQIQGTTLTTYLGSGIAKALKDTGTSKQPLGVPLKLESAQTLKWISRPSLVICVYADQSMMDKIGTLANVVGVIALPYAPNRLKAWEDTWNPTIHGKPKKVAQLLISDPIFEQAMSCLTGAVNLSTSTFHPNDKTSADRSLRILRIKGHTESPENLRAWAIKNQWPPRLADELLKLATKVQALKGKPKLDRPEAVERQYSYWLEKLAEQ